MFRQAVSVGYRSVASLLAVGICLAVCLDAYAGVGLTSLVIEDQDAAIPAGSLIRSGDDQVADAGAASDDVKPTANEGDDTGNSPGEAEAAGEELESISSETGEAAGEESDNPGDVGPVAAETIAGADATNADSSEISNAESETPAAGADDGSVTELPREVPAETPIIGPLWLNTATRVLCFVVLAFLAIASIVGRYLAHRPSEAVNPALVRRFRQRVNAWWLMCAILVFGILFRSIGTVILFGFVSFWALREFITMAPTRRGDHRALFWALIVFTPLQYVLIAFETLDIRWGRSSSLDYYGLYSILIPVYASIFLPARIALSGDPKRFLERSAQITIGLLICVYALSYAPALVNLELTYSDGTPWKGGSQAGLLFFFILVSQLSDVLQWVWGQLVGKRAIAADVSSSRTWEGFIGGTLCSALVGGALCWVTPFQAWEAMAMAMVVSVMGTFGGMTMSAIKRDRGVNDYGSLVMGHAGVLDRIDTLCFAAPVFYHLTRIFFSA